MLRRQPRGGGVRLFVALWALGIAAALSLLAVPLEMLQPAGLHFSAVQFRALSLINPVILLTLCTALGCWLAPKVGLDAPVVRALAERQPAWPALRPLLVAMLLPALIVGAVVAAILLGYGRLSAPWFASAPHADLPMPLITKLLYGGVVEELITRWGLMALFVWAAWKLARSPATIPPWVYLVGASIAALLFAAGHLPLLFAVMPHPPGSLIAAVIVGNAVPGLLFAWLFRRYGLEAAMLAHALSHLLSTAAGL